MRRVLSFVATREHGVTADPKGMAPLMSDQIGSSPARVKVPVRSQRLSPPRNHRFFTTCLAGSRPHRWRSAYE